MNEGNEIFYLKLNEIKDYLLLTDSEYISKIGLMVGSSGIALFYFYYSRYFSSSTCYDKGYEFISNLVKSINKGNNYHTLADGVAGFGWLIEHLEEQGFVNSDTNEILNELDDFAYHSMISDIQRKNFDYLHGALGTGFYFLSRLKKKRKIENYLVKLLEELENESESDIKGGLRWPSLKPTPYSNNVLTNLSLSHGNASIIVFLSKIYEKNILKEKTYRLLVGAVTYILYNQLDPAIYYSSFPTLIAKSGELTNSRLAWCYGDLGIGMAIYQAGKATDNNQWTNKALEILLRTTTRRNDNKTFAVDAGLCHGTSGIAHIYNRMHRNTKINTFKESADYWFQKTLEMAKFDDGLAGYKAWRNKETGEDLNEPGLLEGIAGIGLAMISYLSDIEPAWDECLLLS
jgi:lantibiotic biosynthesis protein